MDLFRWVQFPRVAAFATAALLLTAAGCGGGHGAATSALPESQSRGALAAPTADTLYVSDLAAVNAFALTAANATAPLRSISPHPDQSDVTIAGIVSDASGQLEILQNTRGGVCRIVVEPGNLSGTGPKAGQFACNAQAASLGSGATGKGIALDPSGVVYLELLNNGMTVGDVVQRANTETAPAGTAASGPTDDGGADGSSLIALGGNFDSQTGVAAGVGGHTFVTAAYSGSATVINYGAYSSGAYGSAIPAKTMTIAGRIFASSPVMSPDGTKLYVATLDGVGKAYVDAISATGSGSVSPITSIGPIAGEDIDALAVDAQGNIYVALTANAAQPGGALSSSHVRVYAAGANGKPAPLRILQNPVPSGQPITGLAIAQAPYSAQPAPSPGPSALAFPQPLTYNSAVGITSGPDGALWATNGAAIVRVATGGGADTLFTGLSGAAQNIVSGPDGNLWFTEPVADKIGRMSTGGSLTEYTVPTAGGDPEAITVGPDGNLWFTEGDGNKIGSITTGGAVSEFTIPTADANPLGIANGPDGKLWFTEFGTSKIGSVTTGGAFTEYSLTAGTEPFGITTGSDGNMWFTEQAVNSIGKIVPSGGFAGVITSYQAANVTQGGSPAGITAGLDGNLHFTYSGSLGTITTQGSITLQTLFLGETTSAKSAITTGSDGALWFTESSTVGRTKD